MKGAPAWRRPSSARACEVVFGYPGGVVLPIFDALYDARICVIILTRHEQGAAHMADGYARATGKVGRVPRHQRPRRDQPGHRPRHRQHGLGADGRHHRPGASRPDRQRRLPGGRHHRHHPADHQAQLPGQGREGPAAHRPRGVPHRLAPAGPGRCWSTCPWTSPSPSSRRTRRRTTVEPARLQAALRRATPARSAWPPRRSTTAERPVLYVGGGVIISGARGRAAARSPRRPTSRDHHAAGPGRLPRDRTRCALEHARHARHGLRQLRRPGVRPAHRRRRALRRPRHRQARDLRPARQDHPHRHRPGEHLQERARSTSPSSATRRHILEELLEARGRATGDRATWLAQIAEWKKKHPLRYDRERRRRDQAAVRDRARSAQPTQARRDHRHRRRPAPDVDGAVLHVHARPRQFITSGGLGTMGFGLPAPSARRSAARTRPSIDIDGDGSFQMTMQELATAVQLRAAGQGRASSTTATWAWSASGRSCSGTSATRSERR